MKIGVLELFSWNEVKNGKQKKCFGIDRCCEDCIMGWPIWKCALPDWVKEIIKKMKRWD